MFKHIPLQETQNVLIFKRIKNIQKHYQNQMSVGNQNRLRSLLVMNEKEAFI